jgi:hypothetical protein
MGANSSGIIRALRLFSREFTLPNDLLWSALGRYNEGVDEIVDYLYSQGADPNLPAETGYVISLQWYYLISNWLRLKKASHTRICAPATGG